MLVDCSQGISEDNASVCTSLGQDGRTQVLRTSITAASPSALKSAVRTYEIAVEGMADIRCAVQEDALLLVERLVDLSTQV